MIFTTVIAREALGIILTVTRPGITITIDQMARVDPLVLELAEGL